MTGPSRQIVGIPVERTVHPERVGLDDVEPGLRVRSSDYGEGTVLADVGIGIQIWWDKPLPGVASEHAAHMLTHDKSWVAKLERL